VCVTCIPRVLHEILQAKERGGVQLYVFVIIITQPTANSQANFRVTPPNYFLFPNHPNKELRAKVDVPRTV